MPSTNPSRACDLPEEILEDIFQEATADRGELCVTDETLARTYNNKVEKAVSVRLREHRRAMTTCCSLVAVNRLFRRIGIPLLYDRIVLRRLRDVRKLADSLAGENGRERAQIVRSLELFSIPAPEDFYELIQSLDQVVSLTVNLKRFIARWDPGLLFSHKDARQVLTSLPSLREFGWGHPRDPDEIPWRAVGIEAVMVRFLARQSQTLCHLNLFCHEGYRLPGSLRLPSLQTLRIDCENQFAPSCDHLRSIRSLTIDCDILGRIPVRLWASELEPYITKLVINGSQLPESFSIMMCLETHLPRCTSLRELQLVFTREDPNSSIMEVSAPFPSLQRIHLTILFRDAIGRQLAEFTQEHCPKLEVISIEVDPKWLDLEHKWLERIRPQVANLQMRSVRIFVNREQRVVK